MFSVKKNLNSYIRSQSKEKTKLVQNFLAERYLNLDHAVIILSEVLIVMELKTRPNFFQLKVKYVFLI